MALFNVVQILPDERSHLQAFSEIVDVVQASLEDLGHDVSRTVNALEGQRSNVILGAHTLSEASLDSLPADTIIYNFEQIDPSSMMPPVRLAAHGGVTVWDYSTKNMVQWAEHGIDAIHVPLGFHPCLQRLDPQPEKTIDALFYGSMNPRRRAILDQLEEAGVRTEALFGVYGPERDAKIEQSRLVLNIQFYEARILETARLSYLFANGIPVVSEWSQQLEVPEGLSEAAAFAPYEELPEKVRELLDAPEALSQQGKAGLTAFSQLPMTTHVSQALERASEPPRTIARSARSDQTRVMLVLGCHRSGTSMVSRIMNLGGYELTGPVIAPAADNPAGFWEDQRIAILDDQVLRVLGSRWDDILPVTPAGWRQHPHLDNVRSELMRHLGSSRASDLVIKDPRITVLFPMWQSLMEDLDWEVQTTFVIRDPRAVAESLHARNGFTRLKGIFIWLHHTLMGELHTRSVPRILIDYETLLGSIDTAAAQLHGALEMRRPLDEFRSSAIEHVASDLNHGGGHDPADYRFPAAALALDVYAALRGGADSTEIDALRERYVSATALMGPVVSEFRTAIAALAQQV